MIHSYDKSNRPTTSPFNMSVPALYIINYGLNSTIDFYIFYKFSKYYLSVVCRVTYIARSIAYFAYVSPGYTHEL